jgi:uncharacterized protein YegL
MLFSQKSFAGDVIKLPDVNSEMLEVTEMHVACVFLLDTSGSMATDDAIGKLNEGLRLFKTQTMSFDVHAKNCIDIALVSFGGDVVVVHDFRPVKEMETPILTANGMTPMGQALNTAMDMITEQKELYKKYNTPYYRPWIFCITDGEPNDSWQDAAQRLKQMESQKGVLGYCVGVENFNRAVIASIFNPKRIFELDGLDFSALFEFLSSSLSTLRESTDGTASVSAPSTLRMLTMGAPD